MKYGGQGGWRAVKRLARDANIADGVSPYSYRERYRGSRTSSGSDMSGIDVFFYGAMVVIFIFLGIPAVVGAIFGPIGAILAFGGIVCFVGWHFLPGQESAPAPLAPVPARRPALTCKAATRKGAPCRRPATTEGYCAQHAKASVAASVKLQTSTGNASGE
jgi:hypothetical protein